MQAQLPRHMHCVTPFAGSIRKSCSQSACLAQTRTLIRSAAKSAAVAQNFRMPMKHERIMPVLHDRTTLYEAGYACRTCSAIPSEAAHREIKSWNHVDMLHLDTLSLGHMLESAVLLASSCLRFKLWHDWPFNCCRMSSWKSRPCSAPLRNGCHLLGSLRQPKHP